MANSRRITGSTGAEESLFEGISDPTIPSQNSPLLDTGVKIMDHAKGLTPEFTPAQTVDSTHANGSVPTTAPDTSTNTDISPNSTTSTQANSSTQPSFKSKGFKIPSSVKIPDASTPNSESSLSGPSSNIPNIPDLPPIPEPSDVPGMVIEDKSQMTTQEIINSTIPNEGASSLVGLITSMYERLVPDVSHSYTKIEEENIRIYENQKDLPEGTHSQIVGINKSNLRTFEKRAKEDIQMLEKPLQKVLAQSNVQMSPTTELSIVMVFIAITYFMLIRSVKIDNDRIYKGIMDKIALHHAKTPIDKIQEQVENMEFKSDSKEEQKPSFSVS